MTPKLIIMKDYHSRLEEPYYSAQQDFANWITSQKWNNNNNYFLQLGDLYHFYNPNPEVHAHIIDLFENKLHFKKKIVMAGNNLHEYNRTKKVYVTKAISKLKNVQVDFKPTIHNIEGFKFLTMPWFYDEIYKELGKMKDYYGNLPEEFIKEAYDYIFYHLEDETINFNGEAGIDLSYINTKKRLGGHIHKAQKNYKLGMPVLSRADEKGEKCELLEIDLVTREERIIEVPQFIDFYDVEYNTDLKSEDYEAKYKVFTIMNCLDKKKTELDYRTKYSKNKDFFFRKFEVKKLDESNESIDISDIKNTSKVILLKNFYKKNKVSIQVQNKLNNLIG